MGAHNGERKERRRRLVGGIDSAGSCKPLETQPVADGGTVLHLSLLELQYTSSGFTDTAGKVCCALNVERELVRGEMEPGNKNAKVVASSFAPIVMAAA